MGDLAADAAIADEEDGAAVQLARRERVPDPEIPVPDRAVIDGDALGERQHQGEGMFGDGAGVDVAGHREGNAALGERRGIDRVVADAVAGNDFQPGRRLDQRSVDRRHADDDGVGIGRGLQPLRREVRIGGDREASVLTETVLPRRGDLSEDDEVEAVPVRSHAQSLHRVRAARTRRREGSGCEIEAA